MGALNDTHEMVVGFTTEIDPDGVEVEMPIMKTFKYDQMLVANTPGESCHGSSIRVVNWAKNTVFGSLPTGEIWSFKPSELVDPTPEIEIGSQFRSGRGKHELRWTLLNIGSRGSDILWYEARANNGMIKHFLKWELEAMEKIK
jgi:hypothetical protein